MHRCHKGAVQPEEHFQVSGAKKIAGDAKHDGGDAAYKIPDRLNNMPS